jgi:hypothetical protein
MDDLFLIIATVSAMGALSALLLRSGPAPATPVCFDLPQQTTMPMENNAPVKDGTIKNGAGRLAVPVSSAPTPGANLLRAGGTEPDAGD